MYRIAFFSIYAYGHTNPTLPVVRELTARGHMVRYYSFSPFQAGIEAAGAEFVSCDGYMPPPPKDLDRRIGRDFASLVEMVTRVTLNLEPFLGPDLASFRPDCIVSDSLCFWGRLWAQRLEIPYVCSTTTFAFNRQTAALMRQSPGQLLRLLAGQRRIHRCMKALRSHGYSVTGLLSLIQNDNETDTIVYTSRQFQPLAETFSDRYAFIGPSVPEIVHAPKTPGTWQLYISLGTVNNRNLPFYRACLEALQASPLEVVLSMGSGEAAAQLGPPPPHITIRRAVFQVLEHPEFRDAAQALSHSFRAAGGFRRGADKIPSAAAR